MLSGFAQYDVLGGCAVLTEIDRCSGTAGECRFAPTTSTAGRHKAYTLQLCKECVVGTDLTSLRAPLHGGKFCWWADTQVCLFNGTAVKGSENSIYFCFGNDFRKLTALSRTSSLPARMPAIVGSTLMSGWMPIRCSCLPSA